MSSFMGMGLAPTLTVPTGMGGGGNQHHHHHSSHHHHHHSSHHHHYSSSSSGGNNQQQQHHQPPPPPGAPPSVQNISSANISNNITTTNFQNSANNASSCSTTATNAAEPFDNYYLRDVTGFSKCLYHCAWSCDGDYLSVICGDKNVHISQFDAKRGALPSLQPIHTISTNSIMTRTTWHPFENNRLAICGDEKFVEIWDVRASKAAMKLPTLGNNLNAAWSRDGHYLAVGNRNEYFLVFDTRTGAQVRKKKFSHEMNEMAWSYNSDYLMVASGVDGMGALDVISVFNHSEDTLDNIGGNKAEDLTVYDSLIAHSGACQQLAVDAQCRRLALGGTDRIVSLWSLNDLVCDRFVSFDVTTELRSLSFSPDGQYLAIATGSASHVSGNTFASNYNEEEGVLVVDADTAEPVARVDARMKCSAVAWQPTQRAPQDTRNNNNNSSGDNNNNKPNNSNSSASNNANASAPSVLAVVCDDKNATYSSTSTSNVITSNSVPVFLRLIVFPPKSY